ncbi:transcription factor A, mitochondrial [Daktulosphaira vitifoliae]|uniref:transcription factor A, mitochondrial n=1 Tax=Daktulosphaira vitifoliae TaxID=58002 RepID=UPI0021A9BB61|nr:transcription factor A, mitochondrial [Daktulosphaira vitifoliae]
MGIKQFLASNWRFVNSNSFINRCTNSFVIGSNAGYAQKSREGKLGLPLKPKKPNPPFFKFLQEKRINMMSNDNMKLKDVAQEASKLWKDVDVDSKNEMNEIYRKELEQYKQDIESYKKNLTKEQKDEIMRAQYDEIESKMKRKMKKELKELGKPRKPLTAYLLYLVERNEERGNLSIQDFMKKVGKEWREMNNDSKQKYVTAASVENEKYLTAINQWEKSMINIGRSDLVRISVKSIEN